MELRWGYLSKATQQKQMYGVRENEQLQAILKR